MVLSQRGDASLHEDIAGIEEVVEAAQELKNVTKLMKEWSECARSLPTVLQSEAEVASLKALFCCLVCKGRYC